MFVQEREAELLASEEALEAARTGITELRYRRSSLWSDLLDATEVLVRDPDDRDALLARARAVGALARHERDLAEVVCAFKLHSTRVERHRRL
jgi:hypothetical protein